MAIRDTEREENVEGSILKYAQEKLVDTEDLPADIYEAAGFDSSEVNLWVEVRVIFASPLQDFRLVNAAGDRGQDARVLVSLNIYTKRADLQGRRVPKNVREHLKFLDRVAQYFRQGVEIPIFQLQEGGDPSVQVETLFCMRLEKRTLVSSGAQTERQVREQILWRNMTANLRYTREISTV